MATRIERGGAHGGESGAEQREREREREEWGKKESNEGNSDRFVKISLRLGLATVP